MVKIAKTSCKRSVGRVGIQSTKNMLVFESKTIVIQTTAAKYKKNKASVHSDISDAFRLEDKKICWRLETLFSAWMMPI
jgi:hypothetical protein